MKTKTFHKGGIHPPENKLTSDALPTEILPGALMRVMTAQSIGKEPEVVVKPGDHVAKGDLLAKATAFVSANVHSPADATVKKIEPSRDAQGIWRSSILLEADPEQKPERLTERTEAEVAALSAEQLRDIIADRGIVGLGGATFPTRVKLSVPQGMKAEILIINGAECEPYLTCDDVLMKTRPEDVVRGARLLAKAAGCSRIIIGIEENKPKAIAAMRGAAGEDVEVAVLKKKYPQGGEKQLIRALTGRAVPAGGLPIATGCIVDNVATAAAVCDAVYLGRALTSRIVTVTGPELAYPGNYVVPVGTPMWQLIETAGGAPSDTGKIVAGGPMMGRAVSCLDAPSTKGLSGIVVIPERQARRRAPQPCIRCANCVGVCPMGLEPYLLTAYALKGRWEDTADHGVANCLECGCCSYVCPSSRPLLDYIKLARQKVRQLPSKK